MRLIRLLSLPILVGALAVGCGKDDKGPTGPNVSQFQGTWNATAITYTSIGTPSRSLNAFSVAGARLSMVIGADGRFTGTFLVPPNPTIPMSGSITLVAGNSATQGAIAFIWPAVVAANPPITDFTATYTLSGNNLTFTRPSTNFQFPGQQAAENSTLVIAMTRS